MMESDIGFIGIGNMGYGMAGNVRKKMPSSATLHVFDVSDVACKRFLEQFRSFGPIKISPSSKQVAQDAKTVISMVPTGQNAREVCLDEKNGIIAAEKNSDRLILECSTIDVKTAQDIGHKISAAGLGLYVDTPVSGGIAGASAGTLSFLCGRKGYPETDAIAKRIFHTVSYMGLPDRINFCGDLGSGLVSKIANNYLAITNTTALAEAMAFGIRQGVDRDVLYKCIKASSGNSWVLDNNQPAPGVIPGAPSSNGFKLTFPSRMVVKDLSLAIDAAKEVGIHASQGEAAVKLYQKAAADPRTADLDQSVVWLVINNQVDTLIIE